MHEFVRSFRHAASTLLFASLLVSEAAVAQRLHLPAPPRGPGGEDVIETSSGARCRQSINSNGAYLDVGATGSSGSSRDPYYGPVFPERNGSNQQALGYVRITLPLGEKPRRLDCIRLYEMELERMRREIELLRMAAE